MPTIFCSVDRAGIGPTPGAPLRDNPVCLLDWSRRATADAPKEPFPIRTGNGSPVSTLQ